MPELALKEVVFQSKGTPITHTEREDNHPLLPYSHNLGLTGAVFDAYATILVFGIRVWLQLEGELVVDQRKRAACFTGPIVIDLPAGLWLKKHVTKS